MSDGTQKETKVDLSLLNAAIGKGNRNDAKKYVQQAIDENVAPREILDAMVSAMDEIGGKF